MSATIHLGYLFYRSHRLRKLYFDAEELHNKYSEMKELRRSLKKALAKGDAESVCLLLIFIVWLITYASAGSESDLHVSRKTPPS